jgi:pimeloyl-ACP methyl ester carboxylesterase
MVGNSVGGAVALRLALADPARVQTLTLVDSAGLGRAVNPLLALASLPVIGELAVMISRLPGGAMQRTSMSAAMLFAQPLRVPKEFFTEQHALGSDRVSWRPPPPWPGPCSTPPDTARSCSTISPP